MSSSLLSYFSPTAQGHLLLMVQTTVGFALQHQLSIKKINSHRPTYKLV